MLTQTKQLLLSAMQRCCSLALQRCRSLATQLLHLNMPPSLCRSQELRGNLGLLAHNMQLLASVGIRPTDQDLSLVMRYLRRHQRALTRPQMERLRTAFDAWQLPSTVRKLRELRR